MADVAVLLSGGLDSAVLTAHAARSGVVQPVYVSAGLAWEDGETSLVSRLLASAPFAVNVLPLVRLVVDVSDVYPETHWARRGEPPAYDTPDEDVYLPGRNLLLLTKTSVWCAHRGIGTIALGTLRGNPFADSSPAFFSGFASSPERSWGNVLQFADRALFEKAREHLSMLLPEARFVGGST